MLLAKDLTAEIDDPAPESTVMNLRWEKLSVPVRITVDTNGKTLAAARTAITAAACGSEYFEAK